MNLRVQVLDAEAIRRLTGGVDQFAPQVIKARKRTMKQLMKFAGLQVKKKLAAETGLPQRSFKGRMIFNVEDDGSEGVMWLGTYGVSPYSISSKVLQTKVGVKAGRTIFTGAFKPNRDFDKNVWIRKNHRNFDPNRYDRPSFGSGPGFPVVPVRESIVVPAEEAFQFSFQEIEDRFETIFRQQLTFALDIEG